jgi:hypothetical protein
VFDTLHVSKDIDTVPLVESTIDTWAVGSAGTLGIGSSWFEKENIGACVVGNEIEMSYDTGSNTLGRHIQNEIGVNVHGGRPLEAVSRGFLIFRVVVPRRLESH